MDVTQSIKSAWAAVDRSGLPEHLHEIAFREALRALLGAHNAPAPVRSATGASATNDEADAAAVVDEASVLAAIEDETRISREWMERVFHVDQGVVKLLGSSSKYGSSTAEKARNIALVVTVVRRLGMNKVDTPFDVIKEACESKHSHDAKNFASRHMPSVPGCVVKGEGKARRLEPRTTAYTAFASFIEEWTAEL